jgi:hypothetical protein
LPCPKAFYLLFYCKEYGGRLSTLTGVYAPSQRPETKPIVVQKLNMSKVGQSAGAVNPFEIRAADEK